MSHFCIITLVVTILSSLPLASTSSSTKPTIKILDFDADTIPKPVSLISNTVFSPDDGPTVERNVRVYGGFVDSSSEGSWNGGNQTSGGLKVSWDENKGRAGDVISGLFMFSKEDFLGKDEIPSVTMDESSQMTILMSGSIEEDGMLSVSSSSVSIVFADNTGYHISTPIMLDSFKAGVPFTLAPKGLQYYDFDPSVNGDEAGEKKGLNVPSFEDVSFVGFRIDVKRGADTFKAANVGVNLFRVHALAPPDSSSSSSSSIPVKKTRVTMDGQQIINGFGATVAIEMSRLLKNPQVDSLVNLLFKDLDLDILRIRNWYSKGGEHESEINDTIKVIQLAESTLGRPLHTLLTSWTAPDALKNNGSPNGGTIAYDPTNIMDYHYQDYGKWWTESLVHYQSLGVDPEYLSIQTQPNLETPLHASMKLEPYQQKENGIAGYNMAIEAAIQMMKLSDKVTNVPKFVGPETVGFDNQLEGDDEAYPIETYIGNLVFQETIYAWAHHLYQGDLSSNPDALNDKMARFHTHHDAKPKFITEYCNSDTTGTSWNRLWHLAKVMHNALTFESASAFVYKNLYGEDDALVSLPDPDDITGASDQYVIQPEYYAFKHYSGFIETDAMRLDVSTEETKVFLTGFSNERGDKLTLVILNENADAVPLNIELEGISVMGGEVYRSTKAGELCKKVGDFDPAEGSVKFEVEGESVTTLYLDYVSPYGVRMSGPFMGFNGY